MIKLQTMTLNDLKTISSTLSLFDDFWTIGIFTDELNNSNTHYIVATDNNEIIGFGGISVVLDESTLNNIAVRFDKRKRGVASEILKELINISKKMNCSFITLEVDVNNSPAIRLYEKFGFENLGIRKKYYHGNTDAYIMTLRF